MSGQKTPALDWDQAVVTLGVTPDAGDEDIRRAYVAKVRQFPPDKDPDAFERIRDAYGQLKDPLNRARRILSCPDPSAPLTDLLVGLKPARRFAGPKLWLVALREKMKETR